MNLIQISMIVVSIIMSLVSVAFITLLERKILGFMQMRLGPNKVGVSGILQPFSDAIKLYTKEINWPILSNMYPFFFSPCVSLTLSLFLWICLPHFKSILTLKMSILMFMAILGLGVYPILIAGWSSNSNYSLLGGMRSLSQTISYEVSLIFIMLNILILSSSLNIFEILKMQNSMWFSIFQIPLLLWLISIMAELNRTPFDFAEGESELVSGFNTEYSSGSFAIIFMAEYMMILFFSALSSILFFGTSLNSSIFFMTFLLLMFFFIWTRATLPRYRYDKLMYLCWKIILPISLMNSFLSITIAVFLI